MGLDLGGRSGLAEETGHRQRPGRADGGCSLGSLVGAKRASRTKTRGGLGWVPTNRC